MKKKTFRIALSLMLVFCVLPSFASATGDGLFALWEAESEQGYYFPISDSTQSLNIIPASNTFPNYYQISYNPGLPDEGFFDENPEFLCASQRMPACSNSIGHEYESSYFDVPTGSITPADLELEIEVITYRIISSDIVVQAFPKRALMNGWIR